MPATPAWLASAEALLNRGIDASTRAATLARRLEGTSLQVDIEGITRLRVATVGGRLVLVTADEVEADATISGTGAETAWTNASNPSGLMTVILEIVAALTLLRASSFNVAPSERRWRRRGS